MYRITTCVGANAAIGALLATRGIPGTELPAGQVQRLHGR